MVQDVCPHRLAPSADQQWTMMLPRSLYCTVTVGDQAKKKKKLWSYYHYTVYHQTQLHNIMMMSATTQLTANTETIYIY